MLLPMMCSGELNVSEEKDTDASGGKRDALVQKRIEVDAAEKLRQAEVVATDQAEAATDDQAEAADGATKTDASPPPAIVSAVSLPSLRSSGGEGSTPASEPEQNAAQTPLLEKAESKSHAENGDEEGSPDKPDHERVNTAATAASYERMSDNEWERIQSTITSTFEPHFAQGISLAPTLRVYNVTSSKSLAPGQPAVRTNSEPPKSPQS